MSSSNINKVLRAQHGLNSSSFSCRDISLWTKILHQQIKLVAKTEGTCTFKYANCVCLDLDYYNIILKSIEFVIWCRIAKVSVLSQKCSLYFPKV